jgi:hypothetical protein
MRARRWPGLRTHISQLLPGRLPRANSAGCLLQLACWGQTGLASAEAIAVFSALRNSGESSLTFLGVDGVRVTPLELASAFRWLVLQLDAHSNSVAAQVVQECRSPI